MLFYSIYVQLPACSNADNPFGKKPKRVARSMSGGGQQSPKSETSPNGGPDVDHIQFQPIGGVSFRENKNSDVAIVGKGYSEDNVKVPYSQAQKPKDRRKPVNNKGTVHLYFTGTHLLFFGLVLVTELE